MNGKTVGIKKEKVPAHLEKSFENMLFALMGPKVYPSKAGWKETPPSLEADITMQRLCNAMKGKEEATDAETINYLMNASLNGPISHEYFKIYMWLGSKYAKEKGGNSPVNAEELDPYEKSLLKELKQKIYKKTHQAFKERMKNEKNN